MFDKSGHIPAPSLEAACEKAHNPQHFSGTPAGTLGGGVGGGGGKATGYNADGLKKGTAGNNPPSGGGQRANPPAGVPNPRGM